MNSRRPWALPLVPLYRAANALDAALYRTGALRTHKLQWPVISIGGLSAGGAGKTPVVIALANMLRDLGWHVDILSRGYGRKGGGIGRVTLERDEAAQAQRFGDEPVLIAQRTDVPVWVGSDRFAAGQAAERAYETGVHLLDDGLQHRRLARDFDIVLITADDLNDSLLPAGNLREPLRELRRADALVIREEEQEDIQALVQHLSGGHAPLWSLRRTLRFPQPLGVFSAGLRPIAFCAIARPEGFAAMLATAGCGIVETVAFPDHHAYTLADMNHILSVARGLDATGFVTTQKDAVKLPPVFRERLETRGQVAVVTLEAKFVYKAPVLRTLEGILHQAAPNQPRPTAPRPASEAHLP